MANKKPNTKNLKPFQPGQSGNSKGRPPKDVSVTSWIKEYGDLVEEKNKMTKAKLLAEIIWRKALSGNWRAMRLIYEYYGKYC